MPINVIKIDMKRRNMALYELLEALDIDTDYGDRIEASWNMRTRAMHKDEIQILCRKLDIDINGDENLPELRKLLHEEVGLEYDSKSFESEFRTREMQRLKKAVKSKKYLQVEDLPSMEGTITTGDDVTINGRKYTIKRVMNEEADDAWSYSGYSVAYLESDLRHVILHDYTGSNYSGTFLEQKKGSKLYPKWKKSEYIESFEI